MMWELQGPAFACVEELPLLLKKGSIIDLETTGLEPGRSGIVCLGFVASSRMEIRARSRTSTANEFTAMLHSVVKNLPHPIYAYNAKFDSSMMKKHLGYRGPPLVDLFEPWRSRAEGYKLKFPSLDELVRGPWDALPPHMVAVRDEIPANVVLREDEMQWLRGSRSSYRRQAWEFKGQTTGKDVPRLWREYLKGRDEALREIGEHNRQDLIKTLCLLAFLGRPLTQ